MCVSVCVAGMNFLNEKQWIYINYKFKRAFHHKIDFFSFFWCAMFFLGPLYVQLNLRWMECLKQPETALFLNFNWNVCENVTDTTKLVEHWTFRTWKLLHHTLRTIYSLQMKKFLYAKYNILICDTSSCTWYPIPISDPLVYIEPISKMFLMKRSTHEINIQTATWLKSCKWFIVFSLMLNGNRKTVHAGCVCVCNSLETITREWNGNKHRSRSVQRILM